MFQVKEINSKRIEMNLNADTANIAPLTEKVEDFSNQYLEFEDAYNVTVAVDEAVTNIMVHAYQQNPEGKIHCALYLKEDEFCIQIEDYSERFIPPLIVKKKKFSFDKLEKGGLGLYLMQEFMDELRFLYNEDESKNIIVMKKYLYN